MKKLLLFASILMLSVNAVAQHEVGSLSIQPKVGVNIASITDADGPDPRIGLAAGAEFEYQFTKMFSLSAGALYSMQGAQDDEMQSSGIRAKSTLKLDYINIPILANIYVTEGLALKFGVQPAFNVRSYVTGKAQGVSVSMSLSSLGLDIKPFDLAIPVGMSYEFSNFVVDGRFNIGVMKMLEGEDSRHSVFQLTLGYKFNL